jgi:hypothetical protein
MILYQEWIMMSLYEWNTLTVKLFKEYNISFKQVRLVYRISEQIREFRNKCNCIETENELREIIEKEVSVWIGQKS